MTPTTPCRSWAARLRTSASTSFDVSRGDRQTVAVWAKRALDDVRLNYRIDGGRTRTANVSEWESGERYGDDNDEYYAELRGVVRGADPGDDVDVWFTGEEDRRGGAGAGWRAPAVAPGR